MLLLLIIVVIVVRRRRRKAGTVRADPGYSSTVPNPAFTPHVDGRTQTMFARPRGDRVYDKTAGDGPTYEEAGSGGPPNLYERIDPDTGETYARAGPPKRDLGPIYDLGDAPTYEETKPSRGAGHSLYDLGTESSADHYEALPEEKGGYFMVDSSVPATAAVYDAASPGDRRGTQASRAWDSSAYAMDARVAGAEGAGKARTSITWDSTKYNVATSDGDRRQTLWAVPKDEAA